MVGKKYGQWKKFGVGGKNIIQMYCILSLNFSILAQIYLRSLAKLLQNLLSSDKLFLFTLQLAVVHTAPYVHNGVVEFYFDLGLKQS